MALFKIYKGNYSNLPTTYHEGYAYFTVDTGELFIDVSASNDNSTGVRVQVNAGSADVAAALDDGETHIDIDDILLKNDLAGYVKNTDTIDVEHGGTGNTILTVNAVLLGNGTGTVKMIASGNGAFYATEANGEPQFGVLPIAQGGTGNTEGEAEKAKILSNSRNIQIDLSKETAAGFDGSAAIEPGVKGALSVKHGGTGLTSLTSDGVILGDGTNNVKFASKAKGALRSNGSATPAFGTLLLDEGGTGAVNAADARANLDVYAKSEVYTKSETNTEVAKATTLQYSLTIADTDWQGAGPFTYNWDGPTGGLKCGSDGSVSPLIAPADDTVDLKEYSKIDKAIATSGAGIVFTAKTNKPATSLNLIVIDHG